MKVKLVKTEQAQIPRYQTEGSAGFDLHSVEDQSLKPGVIALVKTGLHAALPQGTELQVRPRSGLALKHGITVLNSPGTVDCKINLEQ
jgi:dUTP pyrophosphatase